jgi:hypothetical protein
MCSPGRPTPRLKVMLLTVQALMKLLITQTAMTIRREKRERRRWMKTGMSRVSTFHL